MNLKKTFIAVTLLSVIWLSAGCVESAGEIVERETEEQLDVRDTLPPLDETASPDSECIGIDVSNTSIYTPDDWDDWCLGYMTVSDIYDDLPQDEKYALCADFWETPDSQLLDAGMLEWGLNRDQTIGFIDFLWMSC